MTARGWGGTDSGAGGGGGGCKKKMKKQISYFSMATESSQLGQFPWYKM